MAKKKTTTANTPEPASKAAASNGNLKNWFGTTWGNIKKGAGQAWNATKQGAGNLAGYAAAHPWMTTGLGLGGAANIAGLFDNDKWGGQAIGGALGGAAGHWLLPKIVGHAVSPQAQVLMGLGGGALGALFDKLRQNKEDQYAAQLNAIQQNTQGGYY